MLFFVRHKTVYDGELIMKSILTLSKLSRWGSHYHLTQLLGCIHILETNNSSLHILYYGIILEDDSLIRLR